MKEYDVTITETLEMTTSKTWYSAPKTGAVTGASGEILFSRARFPAGEWDVYVPASIVFGRPNTAC